MSNKTNKLILFILFSIISSQCSAIKNLSPKDQLFIRGKSVYIANCISCHNANPKIQGSLGPEIFGSSKELLIARLMTSSYPEGYTPKRSSKSMPIFPHLSNDIDALTVFLNKSY